MIFLSKPGMVVHTWNHSTYEDEAGESQVECPPGLQIETQTKKKNP